MKVSFPTPIKRLLRNLCRVAVLWGLALPLLSGCASTIRSEVTAFHQWPSTLPGQTYVFMRPATNGRTAATKACWVEDRV